MAVYAHSLACTQMSAAPLHPGECLPPSARPRAQASLARVGLAGRGGRIHARRCVAPYARHRPHRAYHARRRPMWPVKHVRRRMEVLHLWVSLHHRHGG